MRRPWHITKMRNLPLRKQTTKCSDASDSRVGRSTILLKPQGTTVWWKIQGQKFVDQLCVKLRRNRSRADRLGLQLTDANTRTMSSGVRTETGRPGDFTRDRAFFTPLPYLSTDCIWRWGFPLIPFTAKSALSLCNWPRPNKQFQRTHTFSYSPALHVD